MLSGSTPPVLSKLRRPCPGRMPFVGKITPAMLARADRLAWVQSFTASLEHYMFPALVEHHCVLTNVRGLFRRRDRRPGDGLRPLFRPEPAHVYPAAGRAPLRAGGRASQRGSARLTGPGTVNAMDRATIYLPHASMGIVGMGGIGCEIARRALAFGMSVRGVDRFPDRTRPPEGVSRSRESTGCPNCCAGAISR